MRVSRIGSAKYRRSERPTGAFRLHPPDGRRLSSAAINMNYHIEHNGSGVCLWLNNTADGIGRQSPPSGKGFCESMFPELVQVLEEAHPDSRRYFVMLGTSPQNLAWRIARELQKTRSQLTLPSGLQPPTITVHEYLAAQLKGTTFPMPVDEFIRQFNSSS